MLTIERLKEVLSYDPETGIFTWKKRANVCAQWNVRYPGTVAGNKKDDGYLVISIDAVRHSAHRLAWLYVFGRWPRKFIDHINGEPADNRIANLREANHSENAQNLKRLPENNTSGFVGVTWKKATGRWQSQIKINKTMHFLGCYDSKEEARAAYLAAKQRLHTFQPVPRSL